MNAPKIISLVAFLFYGAVIINAWFALAQFFPRPNTFYEILGTLYGMVLSLGLLNVPFVSNLAYYLFLRKRSKENRLPKYAIPVALFLALVPLAFYLVLSLGGT